MPTIEEQQQMQNTQLPLISSTGFTLDLGNQTSALDLVKSFQSPFTAEDTKKLVSDLRGQQLKIAELLRPTQREQELREQIGAITGGLETSIEALRFRPGLDIPTFGRAVTEEERTARARLGPLQTELGLVQEARAGELAGQKFLTETIQNQFQMARQLEQDALQRQQIVMQQVNTLTDNARQAFDLIVSRFGGLAFENLDPATQEQVRRLTRNVGLPEGLLREGLRTIREQQLARKDQQLQTEITDIGNRRVLINRQTGEVIKDLGPRPAKTTREDDTFTDTQINKGAAIADIPIKDFEKLEPDIKNYFINNASQIKAKKKMIDEAKGAKENPSNIEKELSESNLPDAVKDTLVRYLWSVFPRPQTKKPGIGQKIKSFFKR